MSSEGDRLKEEGAVGTSAGEKPPRSSVSTRQQHIANMARKYKGSAITTLNHHLDLLWLHEAYRRVNANSAPGVDGQTVADYGRNLEANLKDLLERVHGGRYRAPLVKRVHLPKNETQTRPIGMPTVENKVLERAVQMLLEPIYEEDFRDCSYGFRPGRSPHQALEVVRETVMTMQGGWVLDVDVKKYFDTIPHHQLREIVSRRMQDGVISRLIAKWLKAGIMEDGQVSYPEAGTPQGGVISPLLSNIYLHEVLDCWVMDTVRPRLKGRAELIRFADDFILICERREEAFALLEELRTRFAAHGLTIHPEKTRIVDFRHPWKSRETPQTFDFLGFTHYWGKTQRGGYAVTRKTSGKKLRGGLNRIGEWCKRHRHESVRDQHCELSAKVLGHYQYYGIRGNFRALKTYRYWVERHWFRWLERRSRERCDGAALWRLIQGPLALPRARIVHSAISETVALTL